MKLTCTALFSMLLVMPALAFGQDSDFQQPELMVQTSPAEKSQLAVRADEQVVDFDVWSTGPEAALLVRTKTGAHKVLMWKIGAAQAEDAHFDIPADFEPRSIATHPQKRAVFLSGKRGQQYIIAIFEFKGQAWQGRTIYFSQAELRRLVVAPRPFITGNNGKEDIVEHRLLFGARAADGSYGVRTITEEGKRDYEVIGPEPTRAPLDKENEYEPPASSAAAFALPSAFHPAGHILIWEDGQRCFHKLPYNEENWGKPAPLLAGNLCGGSLTVTPNGAGLIHWQPRTAGVTIYLGRGKQKLQQATDVTFLSTPSSVPDGKGLVGLVRTAEGTALAYVPISVPLADVANAWMFMESPADQELFAANDGLMRDLPHDQLYQLYDTESYQCGGYNSSVPTRPYLVTTDLFWEIFAAAYEGTFIVQERQRAIPAFWQFVKAVNAQAAALPATSPWKKVFRTAALLQNPGASKDPEVARILRAAAKPETSNFGNALKYSEFKPRGHYTSDPEFANYFRAFHYLTTAAEKLDASSLRALPASVKTQALNWIGTYDNYIAPGRGPLVWKPGSTIPPYARHPAEAAQVFPLSWGFDNEILLSTVFHGDWPPEKQIAGPGGERLLASGLDVAAALGSNLARALLADEIKKYPPLGTALDDLNHVWRTHPAGQDLYRAWISALAVQWADEVSMPGQSGAGKLWQAKRLQTGMASWTTLRHATVLVNERTIAECGEGGFEYIKLAPPRGYVEPDPKTFGAISGLFEHLAQAVASSRSEWKGALPEQGIPTANEKSLRQGVLNRLKETAAKARLFETIASKELRGEPLSAQDYEEILYVGRVAEHHFLVYKSLASKDLALSIPDPMPKTADVAAGPNAEMVLQAAVGRPLEWDLVTPFFGRREIVKGSVYSYYEFSSPLPLSDADWLAKLKARSHPDWIKPFLSDKGLSCPAAAPF